MGNSEGEGGEEEVERRAGTRILGEREVSSNVQHYKMRCVVSTVFGLNERGERRGRRRKDRRKSRPAQ